MKSAVAVSIFGSLLALTSLLAQDRQRVSPHETVRANIEGNEITIIYGRPYTKDPKSGQPRTVWGSLVPYGKIWRMGADEATILTTKRAIVIGETTIPAGSYSLYLLPGEDSAKLVVNKQTGQWGTKYDEGQDLARIDLQKTTLDEPVDQFTIAIDDQKDGGVLKLSWEKTQFSTPFTVAK